MPIPLFILITAGVSDINILSSTAERNAKYFKLSRGLKDTHIRDIHDYLRVHLDELTFVGSLPVDAEENDGKNFRSSLVQDYRNVFLPKIMPALDQFDEYNQGNQAQAGPARFSIAGVLVLNTKRDLPETESDFKKFVMNEPHACGPVIAKYLSERYQLTFSREQEISDGSATWIDYLTGSMDISPSGNMNRMAADTIDTIARTICSLPDNAENLQKFSILYLNGGGFPIVKNFVRETLNYEMALRGGRNPWQRLYSFQYPETEGTIDFPTIFNNPVQDIELESFQIRKQVAFLVNRGQLVSAGDTASLFSKDERECVWTNQVRQLAAFFKTVYDDGRCPINEGSLVQAIIGHEYREVIRSALRIEAALKRNDQSEAIVLLLSFWDSLKYAFLTKRLQKDHPQVQFDTVPGGREIITGIEYENINNIYRSSNANGMVVKNVLYLNDNNTIYYDFHNARFQTFLTHFRYRNPPAEEALQYFMNRINEARTTRNLIVHQGGAQGGRVQQVVSHLATDEIFSNDGKSFLSGSRTISLLDNIIGTEIPWNGVTVSWASVYPGLVKEALDALRTYELSPPTD